MFYNGNGNGSDWRQYGPPEVWPYYGPPPGYGGGGGYYPSSGSGGSSAQSSTETSKSKTDATTQLSLGETCLVLGLFVVLPVGFVVWVILTLFGF
jgi:hypothetical protein